MPKRRRLVIEEIGDETHVRFAEPKIQDKPNIEAIADELFHLVDFLGRRKLRIDFANIDYLSSAALGKLVSLNKKLHALEGSLVLCNVPAAILRVFEIAGLQTIFDFRQSEASADAPDGEPA